ncbi:DUF262 domain-containing protein [Actinoplanes friuliensis]|uniref:GmrSD restriction endonucleases N-terminal domain-containing protein n=1 Tax=Actinoplanes friuliensis DSM 7358 TaxID=1246995 RepID=U5VWV8_9ACTN|nr:DUF262 domain-containing protein [Actinoplanes friuliensis]AGZ40121.1 hypothetical protein AFR_09160 [Actinoplanes friuliensis DSM 7358]
MRANVASKLETKTPILADLIKDVRDGLIKVPQFQRPFVWKPNQARDLLDSIGSNYPIGSLLLWKTTEKLAVERNIGDFRLPETEELSPTDYVLDGQQRMTVIYAALGAEPKESGFSAVYNLQDQEFLTPGDDSYSPVEFPLRWMYRTTELLNFRTALQSHPDASTLQPRLDELVHVFTNYRVPVVILKGLTVEEVCPIFERINNSATRLSIFDLMVAATWSKSFDLNDKADDISLSLESKSYGDIPRNTVLKCLSALENKSVAKERIMGLRKKTGEEMEDLVARTKKALMRSVDQLVTDFKIYSIDFLPYEAHLVILTYIWANNATLSAEQLRRVRQWFWRTAFSERYRGASENFISKDLEGIQNFVVSGGDLDAYGSIPSDAALRRITFRKNNSRSAAFVLALAKQGPVNLTNGAPIDTSDALSVYNKKQFHHIYPEAYLRNNRPDVERNYLLNFCMLAASENNKVSDDDPNVYLPQLAADLGGHADSVFRSNLMPAPSDLDYGKATLEEFLEARLPIVREVMSTLCEGNS